MRRDPYSGQPRLPSTLHGYSYVSNNPINRSDPLGLCEYDPYDPYLDYDCWVLARELSNKGFGVYEEFITWDYDSLHLYHKLVTSQGDKQKWSIHGEIYNPNRTEPLIVDHMIYMPYGYPTSTNRPPEWDRYSQVFSITGLRLEWMELTLALILLDGTTGETAMSGGDVLVSAASCYYGGQCGWTPTPIHPNLPPMFLIGQDFLVSASDLTLPPLLGLGTLLSTGNPLAAGGVSLCTDIITTGSSIVYDSGRLNGEINYRVTIGISREPKAYVIVYPDVNGLSIINGNR